MTLAPIGYLDVACHAGVWGWVDIARLSADAEIEIIVNGCAARRVRPTLYRPDLAALAINGGDGGFEARLNLPLDRSLSLSARIVETGEMLHPSPVTLPPLFDVPLTELQEKTRRWLDRRYGVKGIRNGIYKAHQPIYGFRKGYSEKNWANRYLITWHILQALAQMRFATLLDAGGGEGYKAAMVRDFLGGAVTSADLSIQACCRARDIYRLPTLAVDGHRLPFRDAAFDVVLASETLEHVVDYRAALAELLRVARQAVVLTVPHEDMAQVAASHRALQIHGHLHAFDCQSFDEFAGPGVTVTAYPILSRARLPTVVGLLMEATPAQLARVSPGRFAGFARSPTVARLAFNRFVAAHFLSKDRAMIVRFPQEGYEGIVAILVKDPSVWRDPPARRIRLSKVMGYSVPYHRPVLE